MSNTPAPYFGVPNRNVRRWPLIVAAVLLIVVGAGFLVWPFFAASLSLAVLFGSALIAGGIAIASRAASSPLALVSGLVFIAAGVFSMVFAEATVAALVAFVGVGLVVFGALWTLIGLRFARRAAVVLPGVLLLIGGVIALVMPALALVVMAIVVGLCLISLGVLLIWLARKLQSPPPEQTTIIL